MPQRPQCGAAMKLRSGRGGTYFLGCSKYPKCKGTAKVSPALQTQIDATSEAAPAGD